MDCGPGNTWHDYSTRMADRCRGSRRHRPGMGHSRRSLSAVLLLFTAVLFAAGLRPIVNRMAKCMPFGVAVGLAFGAVIVVASAIGFVLIQPLERNSSSSFSPYPATRVQSRDNWPPLSATSQTIRPPANSRRLWRAAPAVRWARWANAFLEGRRSSQR